MMDIPSEITNPVEVTAAVSSVINFVCSNYLNTIIIVCSISTGK